MARPRHLRFSLTHRASAFLLVLLASAGSCSYAQEPVILATTSSVANSGLLDIVITAYPHATVRPVLLGSGRALDMLMAGTADVAISHAPAREAAALEAHPSWTRQPILYNDFLIVGPREDPAAVKGANDVLDAMARIARAKVRFLSRGDESGTHEREEELWTAAGARPDAAQLVIAGAGMGQTLRIADRSGAYTLTDRATYETLRSSLVELVVVHEGDPRLLNVYAVISDPGRVAGAQFAAWLVSGAGRDVVATALDHGRVKGFTQQAR